MVEADEKKSEEKVEQAVLVQVKNRISIGVDGLEVEGDQDIERIMGAIDYLIKNHRTFITELRTLKKIGDPGPEGADYAG